MSITPLHFGLIYPVQNRIHIPTFIAVNVMIDLEVYAAVLLSDVYQPASLHGVAHTIVGALILGLIAWTFVRTKPALYAALYGAISHILIDSMYHTDVWMFSFMPPDESWQFNPIYGLLPHWAIDLTLLLLLIPVGWQCFQWCRAKILHKLCF